MTRWLLDEAGVKLDEIMDRAIDEGPQEIVSGGRSVFLLTEREYLEMLARRERLVDLGGVGPAPE